MNENAFFRDATMLITSSLDIREVLEDCVAYLKRLMPVSGAFISIYDSSMHMAEIIASVASQEFYNKQGITSLSGKRQIDEKFWDFLVSQWAEENWVRVVNHSEADDPRWRQFFNEAMGEEYSVLMIDLKLNDEKFGNFVIHNEGKDQYTDQHAHLLSLLHGPLAICINNYLRYEEINRLKDMLADENRYLHDQMAEIQGDTIVGARFGLKEVTQLVQQVAPLNSPVLLMGETGVGKEIIADAIHRASKRSQNPMIRVNCGAIPENLIDSELFGHEKGAFTGATTRKRGRFERAHTGTIFLDEIGELPLSAQVRLLRVLQEYEIERVGGTETIPVNVRIISATNRNLEEMVKEGTFREDLWFRLNVVPITIPPLRQRLVDIPALVDHFLERKCREMKIRTKPILTAGSIERYLSYQWPGNVRELENLVERSLILNQMQDGGPELSLELPSTVSRETRAAVLPEQEPSSENWPNLDDYTGDYIKRVLASTDGLVQGEKGAARILGINPSTLRSRMKKLGIPYGRG